MRRREFITLLGGAAGWPLAARAQQPEQMRRIGMLWILPDVDPQAIIDREAFNKQLHLLGWRPGDNVQVDNRWAPDVSRQRASLCLRTSLWPRVPRTCCRGRMQVGRRSPSVWAGRGRLAGCHGNTIDPGNIGNS